VRLEPPRQLALVARTEPLPRIEIQHLIYGLEGREDLVAAVHAAGGIFCVAHVGVDIPEIIPADERAPDEVIIPGAHERKTGAFLELRRAIHGHREAGDDLE